MSKLGTHRWQGVEGPYRLKGTPIGDVQFGDEVLVEEAMLAIGSRDGLSRPVTGSQRDKRRKLAPLPRSSEVPIMSIM
jgi:hypothetical protein